MLLSSVYCLAVSAQSSNVSPDNLISILPSPNILVWLIFCEGVITGIGFLGAGSIIQSRGTVHGLTTGASVWISGAVGVACGLGAYWIAIFVTVLAFATLAVLVALEPKTPDESGPE